MSHSGSQFAFQNSFSSNPSFDFQANPDRASLGIAEEVDQGGGFLSALGGIFGDAAIEIGSSVVDAGVARAQREITEASASGKETINPTRPPQNTSNQALDTTLGIEADALPPLQAANLLIQDSKTPLVPNDKEIVIPVFGNVGGFLGSPLGMAVGIGAVIFGIMALRKK